jgi:hypothetical protein
MEGNFVVIDGRLRAGVEDDSDGNALSLVVSPVPVAVPVPVALFVAAVVLAVFAAVVAGLVFSAGNVLAFESVV